MKNQNTCDAVKAFLKGKIIAMNVYIKKNSQINNLTLCLIELEQTKPKVCKRKEMIKMKKERN